MQHIHMPTFPSNCAVIILFKRVPVHQLSGLALLRVGQSSSLQNRVSLPRHVIFECGHYCVLVPFKLCPDTQLVEGCTVNEKFSLLSMMC